MDSRTEPRAAARAAAPVLLALALLATPAGGETDETVVLERTGVTARVHCPWPPALNRGYLPIFVEIENPPDRDRDVTLLAFREYMRAQSEVVKHLRLEAGFRGRVELLVPVSPTRPNGYTVRLTAEGEREPAEAHGIGAPNWPGSSSSSRPVAYLSRRPPPAGQVESWAAELSWEVSAADRMTIHPLPGGGQRISTSPASIDNVVVTPIGFEDLPRAQAAWSSLDAAILDASGGELPPREALEPLMAWVRLGGLLIVTGEGAAEAASAIPGLAGWLEERFERTSCVDHPGGVRIFSCGLGTAMVAGPGEGVAGAGLQRCMEHVLSGPTGWHSQPAGGPLDAFEPLIGGLNEMPYRTFTVLLVLFALLIGPVNFSLVKRLGRPSLLLLTLPLLALVLSLSMVAYGVLKEGLGTRTASETFSVLDQRGDPRASTAEMRQFFAGLSPGRGLRPGAGTSVFVRADERNWDGDTWLRIDLSAGAVYSGDYLPVRRPTHQEILSDRSARLRLVLSSGEGGLQARNGLSVEVEELVVRSADGRHWALSSALAPEGSALLEPIDPDRSLEMAGRLWPSFHSFGAATGMLPPATYLARLSANPLTDDCGIGIDRSEGTHRLFGVLDPTGEEER